MSCTRVPFFPNNNNSMSRLFCFRQTIKTYRVPVCTLVTTVVKGKRRMLSLYTIGVQVVALRGAVESTCDNDDGGCDHWLCDRPS